MFEDAVKMAHMLLFAVSWRRVVSLAPFLSNARICRPWLGNGCYTVRVGSVPGGYYVRPWFVSVVRLIKGCLARGWNPFILGPLAPPTRLSCRRMECLK